MHPLRRLACLLPALITLAALTGPAAAEPETLLIRMPAVSADHLAFIYGGDLWIAGRDGQDPRRLTVEPGEESQPAFSPDGRWLAFTGHYDGNQDVYVVSVDGGQPRRLTYHPDNDKVQGWTPDGRVLFNSTREGYFHDTARFFTVSPDGGLPQPLPIPSGFRATSSPDGKRIAYTPLPDPPFGPWKRHRGGVTPPIWLFDLASYEIERVPHENASDIYPVWLGDTLYFISDRSRTANLFAYATGGSEVRQLTHYTDFDVKSVAGYGQHLVYEQAGRLHELDLATGADRPLAIAINPDQPATRPHWVPASEWLAEGEPSPSGVRAVFSARGEILTVPAKDGAVLNLTHSPGTHDRDPTWSPDGRWIAYLSDASGEYQLMLQDATDPGAAPQAVSLGTPSFYYQPTFSPDSRKLLFTDKRLNLYYLDLTTRKPVLVDTDGFDHPVRSLDPAWSPDSRWITYTKRLPNHLRAVFVYQLEDGSRHQVTDGRSDATFATFSRDGKYLLFTASGEFGLNAAWLDMSSYDRPEKRSLYLAILSRDEASPLAPKSDDETVAPAEESAQPAEGKAGAKAAKKEAKETAAAPAAPGVTVEIDFEGLDRRIIALPLDEAMYSAVQAAEGGLIFYLRGDQVSEQNEGENSARSLYRFDLAKREGELFQRGVLSYQVSANGKQVLFQKGGHQWSLAEASGKAEAGTPVAVGNASIQVDPRAEWRQIYDEVWRIQRDFFYDPGMHGQDWAAVGERYRAFLPYVSHRQDLNYLLTEMVGELTVGHAYTGGGDVPNPDSVPVGLLGADLEQDGDAYRLAKIYPGATWYPHVHAPLAQPGVDVAEGDYLLAINGQPLKAPTNPYALLAHQANKLVELTVNSRPTLEGARRVTVMTTSSENALRGLAWVEANRKRVDELSGGRVAYVYVPSTAESGYQSFNRYYFSQLDRQAVVVDERYNSGGLLADYIIDLLQRRPQTYWATREGGVFSSPLGVIDGPKALVINALAASGGDALPWLFRRQGVGKLVGTRTWGGLIGIFDYPSLIDGGFTNSPRVAIFSPEGEWVVENQGVAPDVEVEMLPKEVIAGHDPQLEAAVKLLLEELERNPPPPTPHIPPYPKRAVQ